LPGSTYRLETFGKLSLTGATSGTLSHQRRRLALLAVLAASGEKGISRDKLIDYLWSESNGDSGRHSLEQLLHALRRSLGDSVFSGTNPLSLNSEVIASDVEEFNRAMSNGAFADAASLYRGPFLEGFYLDDAAEFERWSTSERSRLAERYADALNHLASDAEKAGDHGSAIRWRRRLVEADPVSSRHALALMRALVASGDQTAALQHARIYESLVRQELDSEPDPSITKYAAALRARAVDTADTAQPRVVPAAQNVAVPGAPQIASAAEPAPVQAAPHVTTAPIAFPANDPGFRRRALWIAGLGVAAATIVVAALYYRREQDAGARLSWNRIVVVPFRVTAADSSLKYLGEGAADLIAPMLTGEGGPIAVDSRSAISTWNRLTRGREGPADDARRVAKELGAGLALSGAMVESSGRLSITGSIVSVTGGDARPLTSVSGPVDSLDKLLDTFVAQILVRQSGVTETSGVPTTKSLAAIRSYLEGRAAYRRADEQKAVESFSRALEIDSTFARAALDLAVATGNLLRAEICRTAQCRVFSIIPGFAATRWDENLFDRAARLAWQYRTQLPSRDQLLLAALRGSDYPRESSARETFVSLGRAVQAAPDRPEAHYLLGTLLMYQGAALGLSNWRVDAESAFRTASRLDSNYLAPLAALVDIAAFARDTAKLRRAAEIYLSHDDSGPTADYVRWLVGVGSGDAAAQRLMRARLSSLNRLTLDHIFLTSQMSGMGLEDADAAATLLADYATDPLEKSVAFRRAQVLALNRGRPAEASRLLSRMSELGVSSNAETFAVAAGLTGEGDLSAADSASRQMAHEIARDTLGKMSPNLVRRMSVRLALAALWSLNRGDTTNAASASAWLRRHAEGLPRNSGLMLLSEMLVASRSGRANAAALRARIDSTSLQGCCAAPDFVNVVLVQAYEASGSYADALRVVRRSVWYYPPRSVSWFLREQGKLAARAGKRTEAIGAYEQYLALRSNPEPSLIPQRDTVRAELIRLKSAR
jgi:DNA-binding SARP family transcriptional activator/TolB-like protein